MSPPWASLALPLHPLHKPHGFVLTQLEGKSEDLKLNGQVVGPLSVPLLNGDTVELAGSSMRFVVE
ncbi:hypothetical protein J4714_13785 [Staphylococcus epidermidis]|nr:hypothetical protein [Staphylococcus epidermidis]